MNRLVLLHPGFRSCALVRGSGGAAWAERLQVTGERASLRARERAHSPGGVAGNGTSVFY